MPVSAEEGAVLKSVTAEYSYNAVGCADSAEEAAEEASKPGFTAAAAAEYTSWAVNVALLAAKLYLFIVTLSKSVLAALVDSVVDIISQFLLTFAGRATLQWSDEYPVGRFRLEALSVLGCGAIMSFANLEVVQFSCKDLYDGIVDGVYPTFDTSWYIYMLMAVCIGMKFVLWLYCRWAAKTAVVGGDMLEALAEDHLNDVLSNSVAIACLAIAAEVPNQRAWWVDATGAILIALYIVYRWLEIGTEQVQKIVGRSAPKEWIEGVEQLAENHDPRVSLDCIRAYHVGTRFCVELEIVLPATMTVRESHDLALTIQHKIEELQECERAFVHVDHARRDGLEHKPERELLTGSQEVTSPGPESVDPQFKTLKQRKNWFRGSTTTDLEASA